MKIISNHIVELIALLAALWNYKHIRNTRYFYFIPLLAFTLMGELGASYFYVTLVDYQPGNTHIYLWVVLFEFLFFGYQFYHILLSRRMRTATVIGTSLLVFSMLFWFCFYAEYSEMYYNTMVIGGFFLCCLCCTYLYEQFVLSDDFEVNLMTVPDFWMVTGILIFFVGISISFALHYFLKGDGITIFGMPLYHFFPQVLSVFLYGCITVAIIQWKKYQEKLLSA
jgi:hypothetical protein